MEAIELQGSAWQCSEGQGRAVQDSAGRCRAVKGSAGQRMTLLGSAGQAVQFFGLNLFYFYLVMHAKIQTRRPTPSALGEKKKEKRKKKEERCKLDFRFFLYCTARQHPAQKASY